MSKYVEFYSPSDFLKEFRDTGIVINTDFPEYRIGLKFIENYYAKQNRIGFEYVENKLSLSYLAKKLISWLPSCKNRLLWIEHWNFDNFSLGELAFLARKGMGETRSFSEVPGHFFRDMPFKEIDACELDEVQKSNLSFLAGLISIMILESWDGWLIASDAQDRIEFWEGNVYFYSNNPEQISNSKSLIGEFGFGEPLA